MKAVLGGSRRLIVFVGPSGAGKDSVISAWLQQQPAARRPHRARRTITRPADPHEDHESIEPDVFQAAARAGAFAFHWQAHGLSYGVRHAEVAPLAMGRWVVLNGSREHLATLRDTAAGARVVAIDAPAAVRQQRLQMRAREDVCTHGARLARQAPAIMADLRLVNDAALARTVAALETWWQSLTGFWPDRE